MVTRSTKAKAAPPKPKPIKTVVPRKVDEFDEFLLSLPIGQALVKDMIIQMAEHVLKKPEPPEPTMSFIEWMEKMEEAEQSSLKRRPTPHAP